MVNQAGRAAILLFVEGLETTCEMLYLVPRIVEGWISDILVFEAQRRTELRPLWLLLDGERVQTSFLKHASQVH